MTTSANTSINTFNLLQERRLLPSLLQDYAPNSLLLLDYMSNFCMHCFLNTTLMGCFSGQVPAIQRHLQVSRKILDSKSRECRLVDDKELLDQNFPLSTLTWREFKRQILNDIDHYIEKIKYSNVEELAEAGRIFGNLIYFDKEYDLIWMKLRNIKDPEAIEEYWAVSLRPLLQFYLTDQVIDQLWINFKKALKIFHIDMDDIQGDIAVEAAKLPSIEFSLEEIAYNVNSSVLRFFQEFKRLTNLAFGTYVHIPDSSLADDIKAVYSFTETVERRQGGLHISTLPLLLRHGLNFPTNIFYEVASILIVQFNKFDRYVSFDIRETLDVLANQFIPQFRSTANTLCVVNVRGGIVPSVDNSFQCDRFNLPINPDSNYPRLAKSTVLFCNFFHMRVFFHELLTNPTYRFVNAMNNELECISIEVNIKTQDFSGNPGGSHVYILVKDSISNGWFLFDDMNTKTKEATGALYIDTPWSDIHLDFLKRSYGEEHTSVVAGALLTYSYSNEFILKTWTKILKSCFYPLTTDDQERDTTTMRVVEKMVSSFREVMPILKNVSHYYSSNNFQGVISYSSSCSYIEKVLDKIAKVKEYIDSRHEEYSDYYSSSTTSANLESTYLQFRTEYSSVFSSSPSSYNSSIAPEQLESFIQSVSSKVTYYAVSSLLVLANTLFYVYTFIEAVANNNNKQMIFCLNKMLEYKLLLDEDILEYSFNQELHHYKSSILESRKEVSLEYMQYLIDNNLLTSKSLTSSFPNYVFNNSVQREVNVLDINEYLDKIGEDPIYLLHDSNDETFDLFKEAVLDPSVLIVEKEDKSSVYQRLGLPPPPPPPRVDDDSNTYYRRSLEEDLYSHLPNIVEF